MSLINQMLKDIDQRQGSANASADLQGQVRGVIYRSASPALMHWMGGALAVTVLVAASLSYYRSVSPRALLPPMVKIPSYQAPTPIPIPTPVQTPPQTPVAETAAKLPTLASMAPPASSSDRPQKAQELVVKTEMAPSVPSAVSSRAEPSSSVSRVVSIEQRSGNWYRESLTLIRQGRNTEAQGLLRKAIQEYPANHDARQLLARVLVDAGQLTEAKSLLLQGLTLTPDRTEFSMALSHVLVQSNDLESAIDTLQKGLSSAGNNADYHAFLAALLQRQGRHEEATQHYLTALRQAPDASNWLVGLAISLQAQNMNVGAAEAYQRAIDLGLPASLSQFAQDRLRQLGR
jgi:MSHA biogenesis protein MshN